MEQKSLKKAQAGAFVFAIIGLLLLAVPFMLSGNIVDNMAFSKLKSSGSFDFMAIFNGGMLSGNTTDLFGITTLLTADVTAKLSFLSGMTKIIDMVFYYAFIGFWAVCLLLFIFTLLGFINLGFFRFLNKFIALICGLLSIVLLVATLLYFGLGIYVVGFAGTNGIMSALTDVSSMDGFLGRGVYLAIVMFILLWFICFNSFKVVARKANI